MQRNTASQPELGKVRRDRRAPSAVEEWRNRWRPSSATAFLRAVAGPPARATEELVDVLSGGVGRLREILRVHAERKAAGLIDPQMADDNDYGRITLASRQTVRVEPMLVEGWLPRTGIGFLPGASGTGKTTILAHMFARICRGLPIAGAATTRALTILLTNDDQDADFGQLIEGVQREHGLADDEPYVARSLRDMPFAAQRGASFDLTNPEHEAALVAFVQRLQQFFGPLPATLIALETLNTISPDGDDVNPRTIRAIQDAQKRVSRACAAQFLITTHKTKSEIGEFSGHGSIRNSSDAMIVADRYGPPALRGIRLRALKVRGALDGSQLHGRLVARQYSNAHGQQVSYGSVEWDRSIPPKAFIEGKGQTHHEGATAASGPSQPNGECQAQVAGGGPSETREDVFLRVLRETLASAAEVHITPDGQQVEAARGEAVRAAFRIAVFGEGASHSATIKQAWKRARRAVVGESKPARGTDDGALLWLSDTAESTH